MYNYGYRGRRFGFGCLPIFLGLFFLAMIFGGGFHHVWFFVWPLFFVVPFLIAAGIAAMMAARWWFGGFPKRKYGDYFYGDKPKRGGDSDSEIFYV